MSTAADDPEEEDEEGDGEPFTPALLSLNVTMVEVIMENLSLYLIHKPICAPSDLTKSRKAV